MRLLVHFVCFIFTFVSLGGNIYLHKCEDNILLSIYNKVDIDSCPFCAKHHHRDHKEDDHCKGKCSDSVFKIDQLSDINFSINEVLFAQLSPSITPLFWILNFIIPSENDSTKQQMEYLYSFSDSSPPIYIQNCIFRI